MKMFKNKDPRIDFLALIKEANPEFADMFTIDSFYLATAETNPVTEELPFNSRIRISDAGLLRAIGTRYVYFNRIKLGNFVGSDDVKIVKATGINNRIYYADLEEALFANIGTRFNFDGEFADGKPNAEWDAFIPGTPKSTTFSVSPTSLRYYPSQNIRVRVESAGVGLSASIQVRDAHPYINLKDELMLNPELPVSSNSRPYKVTDTGFSMGAIGWSANFTAILSGVGIAEMLEENPEDTTGKYPYRFTETFFGKLNLLFEYYGYPILDKRGYKTAGLSGFGNTKEWCMNPDTVKAAGNVRQLIFESLESDAYRNADLVGETAYNGSAVPLPYY